MRLLYIILAVVLSACTSDHLSDVHPLDVQTPLSSTDSVFYFPKIQNLMSVYCVDCHRTQNARGGITLERYEDVQKYAIKAYNTMESGKMPIGKAKLNAETRNSMKQWIAQGTPYGTAQISYRNDIQPLIESACGSCHIQLVSGGVSLKNYDEVKKIGQDGRLLGTLIENGYVLMPPDQPLANSQIDLVKTWIRTNYAE